MENASDLNIGTEKPTKTLHRNTGCGKIYCAFVEHNNGNFDEMLIRGAMSKNAPCGESWMWGLSRVLTFALRRAFKEDSDSLESGIVKQLLYHQCNNFIAGKEKSCISAIGQMLKSYLKKR